MPVDVKYKFTGCMYKGEFMHQPSLSLASRGFVTLLWVSSWLVWPLMLMLVQQRSHPCLRVGSCPLGYGLWVSSWWGSSLLTQQVMEQPGSSAGWLRSQLKSMPCKLSKVNN
jgi:hypothetical protein